MKKNLFYPLLWGTLTLSILSSCRTDSVSTEQTLASKEQITAFNRFEKLNKIQLTANSSQGVTKYTSYAQPFAEIITKFLENHPDYAERLYGEVGDIKLDVSSQTIGELNKTVIFPVMDRNGKVVSLWGGVINENRDYVSFYNMNDNSEYVTSAIEVFQNYYNRKNSKLAIQATASIKGISPVAIKAKEPKVTNIEEVVITKPKGLPDRSIDPFPPDPDAGGSGSGRDKGRDMSGGPSVHGGSNGTPADKQQQEDPCSKAKSITDNKTFKENKTTLGNKTSEGSEFGFRMNLPVPNGKENQFLTSKIGSQQVDLSVFSNTFGIMHSHYDGLYPMFSPGDIILFNRWVNMVYNNNQVTNPGTPIPKLNDIFFTVVTSEGTYILKFDPSVKPTKLPEYTEDEIENLNKEYKKRLDRYKTVANVSGNVTYNMTGIEKSFMGLVLDKMNMPGLKLIRVTDEGNTEFSTQNGEIKENKCKQ